MAGNLTPGSMFTNDLNALKGWPSNTGLDKAAPLDVSESAANVKKGMVAHLDAATGHFKRGVASRAMPIFLLQSATDFDANSDKYGMSSKVLSGLVANGGYELQTTEYTAGTYAPNVLLKADAATGKVINVVAGTAQTTQDVVGVCSSGVVTNAYGKSVIGFWPCYLPQI
jgi:hypothetical protein